MKTGKYNYDYTIYAAATDNSISFYESMGFVESVLSCRTKQRQVVQQRGDDPGPGRPPLVLPMSDDDEVEAEPVEEDHPKTQRHCCQMQRFPLDRYHRIRSRSR
jgi:hypothetical protein